MNKTDFIQQLTTRTGEDKVKSEQLYDHFVDIVKGALLSGEAVKFHDLCIIEVVSRAGREGRNPQTGAKVMIPSSKSLKIKTLANMKKQLNG